MTTIDATLAWVSRLLSGQKKNDFRPRESDNTAWLEMLQTPVSFFFQSDPALGRLVPVGFAAD